MNELILSGDRWTAMKQQADSLLKSGFLPKSITTPEQAIAIMLKGYELGIGPMEALSGINVIMGKPAVSPQLMLALARRTKELQDFQVSDNGTTCKVTVTRKNQSPVITTFSMDDAKGLGLVAKDNWIKQPKVMRQWRCLAANLRITFPDAIAGLYTPEELGAEVETDEEGRMTIKEKIAEAIPEAVVTIHPPEEDLSGKEIAALAIAVRLRKAAAEDRRERTESSIEKMRKLMVISLEEIIIHPKELDAYTREYATQMRHIFQQVVFGEQSAQQWTGPQIAAVLDWLGLEGTKVEGKTRYVPTQTTWDIAKPGIQAILDYEAEKRGQVKLPGVEDEKTT